MKIRLFSILTLSALLVLSQSLYSADEPSVSKTPLGNTAGAVVKVGTDQITINVPTPVASTGKRGGRRGAAKPTTKLVETSYAMSAKVIVKTVGGKVMELTDVQEGVTVRLHIAKISERKVGEKSEPHMEVTQIDIPNPPVVKK